MTFFRVFIVLACAILSTAPVFAVSKKLPDFPVLRFTPPEPQRSVRPNGVVVYELQDSEIPLITFQIMFRMGSQYEPLSQTGMTQIMGSVWSEGGTKTKTPDQVRETLDSLGAQISISVDLESTSASVTCRKKDFPVVANLLMELLLQPRFDKRILALEKNKLLEAIRRRNDDPEQVARREFRQIIYGNTHPYSRVPLPNTVKSINQDSLIQFKETYLVPNQLFVGISGDWVPAELEMVLKTWLDPLAKRDLTYPPLPVLTSTETWRLHFTQKNLSQSQIRIGHLGIARHDPDEYTLDILNTIWGGGGPSRLFRQVRTEKGLAYSVWSAVTQPQSKGMIVMGSQTQAPQTVEAIQSMMTVMRELSAGKISDNEIASAKEGLINRFIANYTSSAQIVGGEMGAEFNGYPRNYLRSYTQKIGAVSRTQLLEVARRVLRPGQVSIYVLGDLSRFNKPLSTLGRVEEIRLYTAPAEDY